jgi:hypothetical protein
MKPDELLMIVIMAGFALTSCYIVSEIVSFKVLKAMDLASLLRVRALYKRVHSATRPLLERRRFARTTMRPPA